MGIVFKNNAKTTLSSAVNNSTTTIPVTEGSVFPAVNLSGAGTFFLLTLDDETNNEIVKVTSCSGASGNINLTVIRAQEGTTARAFASGDKAELRFTSGTIDEIRSDNTVHTNIFTTANNSTTDFTLSDEVANENDLVVFIDGVFQAHNTFSVSGTTLTLATAPASGRVVTVYSIKGSRSASNVALATMTGDNSDTTLTLPVEPINENSVQVFFDGVYQNKDSFSISGTTLTFGVAPPTGVAVEALVFTKLAINTSSILSDTDADTKVQVEESSDEDKIRFDTAGSERVVIDNAGKVGVGTSSPASNLHISATGEARLIVEGDSDNDSGEESALIEFKTDGGAVRHKIEAIGTGGNDLKITAGSANTTSTLSSEIIFETKTSNSSTAERMRIDSGGSVYFRKTAHAFATAGVEFLDNNITNMTNASNTVLNLHRTGSQGTILEFFKDSGSVGSISTNANSLPSDRNFKRDISDLNLGLDLVSKLKPSQYNYIVDDEDCPKMYGLIAQDLEESLTEVGIEKNSTWLLQHKPNDDEKQSEYSLDYTKLIPILINSIQELSAKIEELKGKIE